MVCTYHKGGNGELKTVSWGLTKTLECLLVEESKCMTKKLNLQNDLSSPQRVSQAQYPVLVSLRNLNIYRLIALAMEFINILS